MKEKIYIVVMCLLLAFGVKSCWDSTRKDRELTRMMIENATLSDQVQQLVQFDNTRISIVYRDRDTVRTQVVYVPVESRATIITDLDGNIMIDYDKWGFGFWPYLGLGIVDGIKPLAGARLMYFRRMGLGVNTTLDTVNAVVDFRLSRMPVLQNSAVGMFYGNKGIGLSFHAYL